MSIYEVIDSNCDGFLFTSQELALAYALLAFKTRMGRDALSEEIEENTSGCKFIITSNDGIEFKWWIDLRKVITEESEFNVNE